MQVEEDELSIEYVKFLGSKYRTEDTPVGHAPENILGLKTLFRWRLTIYNEPNFGFILEA
jgi:hypothetical protein